MVTAISFEYKGAKRIAFPLEEDKRNAALLFCYQVSPEAGPRSFHKQSMLGIRPTALKVERSRIDQELQKR